MMLAGRCLSLSLYPTLYISPFYAHPSLSFRPTSFHPHLSLLPFLFTLIISSTRAMEIIRSKCFRRGQAFKGFTLNCNELLLQLYASGHTTLLLSYYNHTPDTPYYNFIPEVKLQYNNIGHTDTLSQIQLYLQYIEQYIDLFTSSVTEGFTFTHRISPKPT